MRHHNKGSMDEGGDSPNPDRSAEQDSMECQHLKEFYDKVSTDPDVPEIEELRTEMKRESNIVVAVRVRPLNDDERNRREESIVHCPDRCNLLVGVLGEERAFSFDMVLGPDSSQRAVFEECGVARLIDMAIQGFSCTVFAFGQTGSGKTYTITGPHSLFLEDSHDASLPGLMQRSLSYLLERVGASGAEYHLCASYLEVYNEQVRDLLKPWLPYALAVRGSRTQGFYVENLSVVEFHDLDSFMRLLEGGMQNRQSSSHSRNEHTSRSHSILTVFIKGAATRGKLCVVDLAGSERVREGDFTEELLEETGNINRSLLTLGKCISCLVDPKKREGHIPYRDSKLTKLLSDSLGGSGITLMLACVSPTMGSLQETLNTLCYSSRARRIKNRPMAKRELREKLVVSLQKEIRRLRQENLLLRQHLSTSPERAEGSGGQAAKHHGSLSCTQREAAGVRTDSSCSEASLQSLLQELMRENDKLQQDKLALLDSQESSNQQRALLSQENTRLLRKLENLARLISSSPLTDSSHSGLSVHGDCVGGHQHPCTHSNVPECTLTHLKDPSEALPCQRVLYCCVCCPDSDLADGPPQRGGRGPAEDLMTGSHCPGPAPGQPPRSNKCQADSQGYSERYKELRAARAQRVQRLKGGAEPGNPAPSNTQHSDKEIYTHSHTLTQTGGKHKL